MQKLKGVTVLEALITLIIICSLVMIGTVKLKDYQSEIRLNNAMRQVITAIEQAGRISVINRKEMEVTFNTDSSKLHLKSKKSNYNQVINVDKRIEIGNLKKLKVSTNGMISPRIILFCDENKMKKVRIQMAWGRMIYEN